MAVLVSVKVYDMAKVKLSMTEHDTVGDVKHLLEEITTIPHADIKLQHKGDYTMMTSKDDMTLKNHPVQWVFTSGKVVCFEMTSPTISALKIANELKDEQDKALKSGNMFSKGNLTITKDFISLTSHGLFWNTNEEEKAVVKKKNVFKDEPSSSSSTLTTQTFEALQKRIAEIETENEQHLNLIKNNKALLKNLKDMMKKATISLHLRFASGNCVTVRTSVGKTLKQFRVQDLSNITDQFMECRLICGQHLMQNNRRLHGYGLVDGSTIDFVLMSKTATEVSSSSGEDEAVAIPEVAEPVAPALEQDDEETDEEDFDEDMLYYADFDMVGSDALDDDLELEGSVKIVIFTKGRSHQVTLYIQPDALVQSIMNEICDATHLQMGDFDLVGALSGKMLKPDDYVSSMEVEEFQAYFVLRGLRGGAKNMVIRGVMKEKADKKEMMKKHASKTFNEVNTVKFESPALTNAQLLLRALNGVDAKNSENVFRQAVKMLNEEDVNAVISIFDPPKGTKILYSSTEEKVEAFAYLAFKKQVEPLDDLVKQVNDMKVALIAKVLVLYGSFCGTKSDRYNNGALMKLLIGRQEELKNQEEKDESMEELTEMMSASKI